MWRVERVVVVVVLAHEADDPLEQRRAHDLVAHDDGDDARGEVRPPIEVRGDRLREAEGDAGLRKEGHPVAAAVLGGLMRRSEVLQDEALMREARAMDAAQQKVEIEALHGGFGMDALGDFLVAKIVDRAAL